MELLPISEHLTENTVFTSNPLCSESIYMSVAFYKKTGYDIPWIGYYACIDGSLVGTGAFKGKPLDGKVEIAYGIFPQQRQKGIGSALCKKLVKLSLQTDASVRITARTLPEENYSTSILRKNGFEWKGSVTDPEDGEVWEWEYVADESSESMA